MATHEPGDYEIQSVVGLAQSTKQSGRWDGARLTIESSHGGEDMGGDGTVPRVSATPIETDDWEPTYQPMYSGDRHASLQNADAVQTQLLGVLTARRREGSAPVQGVRIEADELLAVGEPLVVRALPDRANLTMQATVTDAATGRQVAAIPLQRDADDVHHGEVPPLAPGDYRWRWRAWATAPASPIRSMGWCASSTTSRQTHEALRACSSASTTTSPLCTPLRGCRNDIESLADYLQARTGVDLAARGRSTTTRELETPSSRRFAITSARQVPATLPSSPTPAMAVRSRCRPNWPTSNRPDGSRR